jgi:hypothetical protein
MIETNNTTLIQYVQKPLRSISMLLPQKAAFRPEKSSHPTLNPDITKPHKLSVSYLHDTRIGPSDNL